MKSSNLEDMLALPYTDWVELFQPDRGATSLYPITRAEYDRRLEAEGATPKKRKKRAKR